MSVGTFNLCAFPLAAETTFGTAVATPTKGYPVRADRPVINVDTVNDDDTVTGNLESGLQSIVTKITATQSVEMDARLDAIAAFSKFTFGTVQFTAGTPNTHTFTVGTTAAARALPSLTWYWQDALNTANNAWVFAGTKVQKMSIKGDAGGKVTMSVDLMIARPVDPTSGAQVQSVTTMPTRLGLAVDPILAMARVSSFKIAGGSDIKNALKSFEFVFENTFDDGAEMAAGSVMLPTLERTGFNVSGSFVLKADTAALSTTLMDTYLNGINSATPGLGLQTLPSLELILGGGVSGHSATITVRAAAISDGSLPGQRGKLEKPFSFNGMYDTVNSEAARIVVANAQGTYV